MSTEIERVSEEEIRQVLLEIADGSENDRVTGLRHSLKSLGPVVCK